MIRSTGDKTILHLFSNFKWVYYKERFALLKSVFKNNCALSGPILVSKIGDLG